MNLINWSPCQEIVAGTTLRDPDGADFNNMALHATSDTQSVIKNRQKLANEIAIPLHHFVFSQQTHSDHLHKVTLADIGKGTLQYSDGISDCDALYTKEKGIAIGVFHADCVPVLLYDPYTNIICAIHSGWQGTVKEITRKTLQHLIQEEGVDPTHLYAYIGPAIALHSFEVGSEVIQQVQDMSFPTERFIIARDHGKAFVDNKGLNRQMLLDLGVYDSHIKVNPNDTFMKNDAFFSYRRDHHCGRHLSYIARI